MRGLKTAILAGASLLALTVTAAADPATLGSLIISAFLAVGAGGLLPAVSATAIGWGAIGIGLAAAKIGMSFLFKPASADPQTLKNTTKGAEGPGRYATGRVELAAKVNFGGTAGYDIYRWLLHCFGPLDGIELYKYGGVEITVEPNGDVSTPPYAIIGGSHLKIETKPGDGTETAWPALTANFPTLFDADCRARGNVASLLKMISPGTGHPKFPKLLQGGIKELKMQARVGGFYDPRDAQTRWAMNGVLQCLHWMRLLPGMHDAILDIAGAADVADVAEVAVPTVGGTRPRCQMSGGWEGPLTYDIFADMLQSTGLEVRRTAESTYGLAFIEDDPPSELTLTTAHIIDNFPNTGPEGAKRPNICKLRYFSPERGFEVAEIGLHERDVGGDYLGADWARIPAEIERYGEQEMPIELVFCPDAGQAQVIARPLFHLARADTGLLKTRMAGIAAWGKKVITIEIPDVGTDGASVFVKVRKGPMRINDQEGYCEIPYVIIPDILKTPWNAATDEVPPPPVLPIQQSDTALERPAAPAEATLVQYLDGGDHETRIRFGYVPGGVLAEAVYREYSGDNPGLFQSMGEYQSEIDPANTAYGWVADNTAGERVEFKVRWWDDFLTPENNSEFSDLLNVPAMAIDNTTPAALVLDSDGGSSDLTLSSGTEDMRVVQVRFEYSLNGGAYVPIFTTDARPAVIYEHHVGSLSTGTHRYRAYAKTSNGTESPVSNIISVVV